MSDNGGKSVVVAEQGQILFSEEMSVKRFNAMQALQSREVPRDQIKTRPGKSGKVFSYIKHTYATDTLINAVDQFFSHDVVEARMMDDGTAMALVRLQIHIPYQQPDGHIDIMTNSITEVGAFEGAPQMAHAYKMASAASRGLVKCLMRRFGLGIDLYGADDEMTWQDAWKALWTFAYNKHGKPGSKDAQKALADKVREELKKHGVSSDTLLDRFEDAYAIVSRMVSNEPEVPSMDDEEDEPPEPEPEPELPPEPPGDDPGNAPPPVTKPPAVQARRPPVRTVASPRPEPGPEKKKSGPDPLRAAMLHKLPVDGSYNAGTALADVMLTHDEAARGITAKDFFEKVVTWAKNEQHNGAYDDTAEAAQMILDNWDEAVRHLETPGVSRVPGKALPKIAPAAWEDFVTFTRDAMGFLTNTHVLSTIERVDSTLEKRLPRNTRGRKEVWEALHSLWFGPVVVKAEGPDDPSLKSELAAFFDEGDEED